MKDGEKRIVNMEESVMKKITTLAKRCSFQSCSHTGATFCANRKKHKGALYVYVLIIMLMVTTLSLITALLFDGNLEMQRHTKG